jgi:DNA-binding NarL/FixJ family response regulator
MKAIIIEDELPARAKLKEMIALIDPTIEVMAMLGSVKETVAWLETNPEPDLAFVDIQLSDDHSFEIFKQHPVKFPVVFTTAYDKFLLESFEFNSVDYLLKPITEDKLRRSIEKINKFKEHFTPDIVKILSQLKSPSSKRILAKKGTEFIALEGVPELRADSRYNRDSNIITSKFSIGVDILTVIVETKEPACTSYELMTAIDTFAWKMRNVEGVQEVMALPMVAKIAIAGWNEGSLKWRNIPREPNQLTQSTR